MIEPERRRHHVRHGETAAHEMGADIDPPGGIEPGDLDLGQGTRDLDAGMVVQDVDAAMALLRAVDDRLQRLVVGDVEAMRLGRAAIPRDGLDRLLGRFAATVRDDDMGALSRQNRCSGPADAGAGPGDDGDAVLEDHAGLVAASVRALSMRWKGCARQSGRGRGRPAPRTRPLIAARLLPNFEAVDGDLPVLPGRKPEAGRSPRLAPAIPAEAFFLDPEFRGTLQQHIQHLVSHGIVSGRFAPGAKMPSSRKLGDHLGVSRITVTLAYAELQSGDYLVARSRSGYYVSPTAPSIGLAVPIEVQASAGLDWSRVMSRRFSGQALPDKPSDWLSYRYPFIYGQVDETLFDYKNWRLCALQALGRKDLASVTADAFESDDPELIKYIALSSLPRRGIAARPAEILITLGAQNALWLCAEVLLGRRRMAAMENQAIRACAPCSSGPDAASAMSRSTTAAW